MTRDGRPETGVSAVSDPETARRWDTWRRWVPVLNANLMGPAFRAGRPWAWVLAVGAVVVAGVRAPGAAGEVWADFVHLGGLRLAWLGVAVAAEGVSLAGGVAAQRRLLAAGGARLRLRTLFGLVLVSTGLARVMPAGPVTGGAWQMREYRRRGAGAAAAVWAVLAGGFTSTMVILASLLAGAAVAHPGSLPLLGCAATVLAAGMAGLTAALRHARLLSHWLKRHHRHSPTIARLAIAVAGLSRQRARPGWAAWVLACTGVSLLADAGVLAACFGLAGLPVPWHGLLFAYAAGQLAVRVVPLPGGLGGVEGGVIGALTLTGTPAAAAAAAVLVYRVGGYWAVGAVGTAAAAALARRPRPGGEAPQQLAGCHDPTGKAAPAIAARPRSTPPASAPRGRHIASRSC
jgi:uncharacterized membrane protein YbhN (UPF0104 family)